MINLKCRAETLAGKEVEGWYCEVRNRHYVIPESARILPLGYTNGPPSLDGFVEVNPDTVELLEKENG